MQPAHRIVAALALVAVSASASAVTTVYTSSASFMAAIQPGAYTESFNGLPALPPSSYASGGYAYTLSSPDGLYSSGSFVGTNQPNESLTITFTSGNVRAVGGNFYATDISDAFQPAPLTLTLSDATTVTFTPTSVVNSFRGFTSTVGITSLTIGAPGASLYAGIDSLTVGTVAAVTVVPEPATVWLMVLGGAGLVAVRKRRA